MRGTRSSTQVFIRKHLKRISRENNRRKLLFCLTPPPPDCWPHISPGATSAYLQSQVQEEVILAALSRSNMDFQCVPVKIFVTAEKYINPTQLWSGDTHHTSSKVPEKKRVSTPKVHPYKESWLIKFLTGPPRGVISIFREPLVVRHCLIRLDQTPRHPDLAQFFSIWGLQSLIPRNYLEQIGFSSNDWLSKSDRSSIHHRVSSLPRTARHTFP